MLVLFLVLSPGIEGKSSGDRKQELELKVEMLERLTRFVEWPRGSDVSDPTKPFIIGVIGKTPLKDLLDDFYRKSKKQRIKDKVVEIHSFAHPEDTEGLKCNLLFISRSVRFNLPKIIEAVSRKPILTVGDTEGFADKGVHINFVPRRMNVKFEVNELEVRQSGLSISYHILRMAIRVLKEEPRKTAAKKE